jgi:hypothetical protein
MTTFTKEQKREIRELCARLWNVEAKRTLDILDEQFDRWRRGDLSHDELLGAQPRSEWVVAGGLVRGDIKLDELSEGLRQHFAKYLT